MGVGLLDLLQVPTTSLFLFNNPFKNAAIKAKILTDYLYFLTTFL